MILLRSIAACALLAAAVFPQQQAPPPQAEEPTIKVDVDLVNVLCSVRNRQGGLVPGLSKDEFTVLEDGKPQEIRYFARETDLPLTIGLLVDVSRSQERLIDTERHAAEQFFSDVLGKKDMAFLISFGEEAELLQDYTNSAHLLAKGLDGLKVNAPPPMLHDGPVPTIYHPRGTILFDAVYLAANDRLKGQVGRKVMVLITDGVDQGSRVKIGEALSSAQKADAVIYAIDYFDPSAYGYRGGIVLGGNAGAGDLKRMADQTGGRVFQVDRKHSLSDAFRQIQEEMRSQYAIGYLPANAARDGGFRHIEIHTRDKDMKVQARKGYFASPRDAS